MRGPKPPVVELSLEERQGLENLVCRHSTPQQVASRGRIILGAAAGLNNSQLARQLGLNVDTVRFYRYIQDRISGAGQIPQLASIIEERAKELNLGCLVGNCLALFLVHMGSNEPVV